VFINIILNALDAMPDAASYGASRHGLNEQGIDTIFVEFRDSGRDPCRRPGKDLRSLLHHQGSGQGDGLGLSVSYNIVKRFKGDIKVASTLGTGTTFTIISRS